MSRRELMGRTAKLGIGAAAAHSLMGMASTRAMAADYDWKANKGKTIKLLLNKHPYADAMIADIESFKTLTGMDVKYDVFPEDVYFDKVVAALSSKSDQYDAFMTGAYQTWTYGPAGWIEDLNPYIQSAKTNPTYNWDDVLPGCGPRRPGTASPAPRSVHPTRSSGAFRGATSSTRSPTTRRCTTS